MIIRESYVQTEGKNIDVGETYRFIENVPYSEYTGKLLDIERIGVQYKMKIDSPQKGTITRWWTKNNFNSATTIIRNENSTYSSDVVTVKYSD